MSRTRTLALGLAATAALAPLAAGAPASAASGRGSGPAEIRLLDDCDRHTFPAVAGCTGDGGTTFEELVEELLEDGEHSAWKNNPRELTIREGQGLEVVNAGGEPHSFNHVAAYGGGCVEEINELLGLSAVPECTDPEWTQQILGPGESRPVEHDLPVGKHRFECLIHPWMHTTVTVRAD